MLCEQWCQGAKPSGSRNWSTAFLTPTYWRSQNQLSFAIHFGLPANVSEDTEVDLMYDPVRP
jgi:hypothetical protein